MSTIMLNRIKYYKHGEEQSIAQNVQIRIESGSQWQEIYCPDLVSDVSEDVTVDNGFWSQGNIGGRVFPFERSATVKIYKGGDEIGSFQVPYFVSGKLQEWYHCKTDEEEWFTVTYCPLTRDIGIDIDGHRTEPDSHEVGLVFAPKYNRRKLKVVTLNSAGRETYEKVSDDSLRQKYVQIVNTGPNSVRNPWRGPYDIYHNQQTLKLKVIESWDAAEFQKGAESFVDYWNSKGSSLKRYIIDNGLDLSKPLGDNQAQGDGNLYNDRLNQVLNCLDDYYEQQSEKLSLIAFFCHGWNTGIQLGINNFSRNDNGLSSLADRIKEISRPDVVVVLYACSTAKQNETSFAAKLRDKLIASPHALPCCRVVGHTRRGHSFRTPYIRIFEGIDGIEAKGKDIAPNIPRGNSLHKKFRKYLDDDSDYPAFRWAYPLMSIESIHEFLKMANPPSNAYQIS